MQKAGFASVEELAERFDVTAQTIRRDVNGLCELGVLRRTHGGVEPPAAAANIHYSTRQILNLPEKAVDRKAGRRPGRRQSVGCLFRSEPRRKS
ncbi:DeoR family transcriptional regulator [Roseibium salinum]|nr:DeoR family transcriptional regulator [Roseibium salinum]